MKYGKYVAWSCVLVAVPGLVLAAGEKPYNIDNRLRVEYDDNIGQTKDDTESTFKIIDQVQLVLDINQNNNMLSLRYQPSLEYWADRGENADGEDLKLNHEVDIVYKYKFSPRLALGVSDLFRVSQLPEVRDDDSVVIRKDDDYIYNSLSGTLGYGVLANTDLRVGGNYKILRYDDDDTATYEDYDVVAGNMDVVCQVAKQTAALAMIGYETLDYVETADAISSGDTVLDQGGAERGSSTFRIGLGVEQTFSPNLLGTASAGYGSKDFEGSNTGDISNPYFRGNLTVRPSPMTSLSADLQYDMDKPDVYPFTSQDKTAFTLSLGHDFTAKIKLLVAGAYVYGKYDEEETVESVDPSNVEDGSDKAYRLSGRLQYKVARNNTIELGWQYTDVNSDVREEYDRNKVSLGWQYRL